MTLFCYFNDINANISLHLCLYTFILYYYHGISSPLHLLHLEFFAISSNRKNMNENTCNPIPPAIDWINRRINQSMVGKNFSFICRPNVYGTNNKIEFLPNQLRHRVFECFAPDIRYLSKRFSPIEMIANALTQIKRIKRIDHLFWFHYLIRVSIIDGHYVNNLHSKNMLYASQFTIMIHFMIDCVDSFLFLPFLCIEL